MDADVARSDDAAPFLLRRLPPPPAAPPPTAAAPPPEPPSPAPPPVGESAPSGRARRRSAGLFGKATVCVSIDGLWVRALRIVSNGVDSWHSQPLAPTLLRGGGIADVDGVAAVVEEVVEAVGGRRARVRCAVSGVQALFHVLTVPPFPRSRIVEVLQREARRAINFSPETSYLTWQTLPGRGMFRAFLLSVPREPLQVMLAAARAAGLKPTVVDLRPLAMARATGAADAIIANAESTSLDLVILVEGLPVAMRSLATAETPLPTTGVQVRLLEELGRVIAFYNDSHRERPLPPALPVFLTGGEGANPALGLEVVRLTGHPVEALALEMDCPPGFPAAVYAVPLGLALKKE